MPSIGQGTRFECRILDHYYENFEEKVKNKALNEKLKFGTNCNAFLDLFYITYVKIGFGDMIPLKNYWSHTSRGGIIRLHDFIKEIK